MLPDSAYFQEIPRTQQPLNSPIHLHPRSRPSHKELLSNFVNPSAAAFPSPPEQDVVRRMPPQSSNSPTPIFASRRSAFTPFKTPNTLQDVRDIYRIGNVQNRSQASGLLTPTSHLLHHPILSTHSNEPNNGFHSYVVDELPSQRTFRPRVLCSQFPASTVLIPSEELPESKGLVSKSENSPSSRFMYPEPSITVQSEDIKPLPSSLVYDPIRDSWTSIDIQEDSPKVMTEPLLTCNTVSTEVELIHEEVAHASPQLRTSPNLRAHETTSKKQPEMISSSWNDLSACNSLPSALPSSPPLSPVAKSNKRRISLSSDSDTYGNPSKLRKKMDSEETEETKVTPPKAEVSTNVMNVKNEILTHVSLNLSPS
ncbi:hypothetical protein K7432_003650 [Basidiobolus ranarum]|uniref:Uncharacterized protein n=1 Tax=Basidiobolus ranarum TaxID=34480 RepID=A0ABR2W5Y7_9FUNG